MPAELRSFIEHHLGGNKSHPAAAEGKISPVGGGSINQAWKVAWHQEVYFCKTNSATNFPQLFEKESRSLALLSGSGTIRLPRVIDCFTSGNQQFLVLEWISEGKRSASFWTTFGEQLARMHDHSNIHFGWVEDNYMGSVPQSNQHAGNWISFFIEQRLEPMRKRCVERLSSRHHQALEKLYKRLPDIFDRHQQPSLVHGDLWAGNFMCSEDGMPVLVDPAAHYGCAAADLGMMQLFGGFDASFYDAYHHHRALPPREQWEVCNLYPLLIHLYLFGSSYISGIESRLQQFA